MTSATNGRDALDLAKRERPDLVLLDVLMPGMSGVDVCRELKRSDETCLTPVVLISGAQERRTILDGLEAGADDVKQVGDSFEVTADPSSFQAVLEALEKGGAA